MRKQEELKKEATTKAISGASGQVSSVLGTHGSSAPCPSETAIYTYVLCARAVTASFEEARTKETCVQPAIGVAGRDIFYST